MSENNDKLTIKYWAEDDRPREKLLLKGKKALSDAELLAILIGSGNAQESAVDLCKRILLATNNNLNQLAKMSVNDLVKYKGIGEAKAISIVAALELGTRRESAEFTKHDSIKSSKDAYTILKSEIANLPHEEFWAIYLSRSNKVMEKVLISRGGITGTVADIRLILKRAIEIYAVSILVAHNHPSGNKQPSAQDITLTKKLHEASNLFEIYLADHIIITEDGYYSFRDEGVLK